MFPFLCLNCGQGSPTASHTATFLKRRQFSCAECFRLNTFMILTKLWHAIHSFSIDKNHHLPPKKQKAIVFRPPPSLAFALCFSPLSHRVPRWHARSDIPLTRAVHSKDVPPHFHRSPPLSAGSPIVQSPFSPAA